MILKSLTCLIGLILSAAGLPAALSLNFVYPETDGDGVAHAQEAWGRLRFAGSTDPEATLTLNGELVRVWPSGAFAGLLEPLEHGENEFTFEARLGDDTARRTITVLRASPPPPLPLHPARILESSITPRDRLVVAPGDEVTVTFVGTPGGRATATLGRATRLDLAEDPRTAGLYRGTHTVGGDEGWYGDEITVRLSVTAGGGSRAEASRPLMLTSLDTENPRILEVRSPDRRHCPLYVDTAETARLMDLPEGTPLLAWGRRDEHWRIYLAPDLFGWIRVNGGETFTELLPRGTRPPRGRLVGITGQGDGDAATLRLQLTDRVPMRVGRGDGRDSLETVLYGLTPGDAPRLPVFSSGTLVDFVEWERRPGGVHALVVEPHDPADLRGWTARWEGTTLVVSLSGRAPLSMDQLRVVLDAGHGGTDRGAIGSTGLREKEINLLLTRLVRDELTARGAEVHTLRGGDETIGLNRRVSLTQGLDPDVFLSLHSNSVPVTSDPFARQGVEVYHSHAVSRPLADAIRARMAALGEEIHDGGTLVRNFRVTRPHQRPSVLVETLYLPNPHDEMILLAPDWQRRLAWAVADGVEDWLRGAPSGTPAP